MSCTTMFGAISIKIRINKCCIISRQQKKVMKKIKRLMHICAKRNYFRFAAAILETDGNRLGSNSRNPPTKHVGHT